MSAAFRPNRAARAVAGLTQQEELGTRSITRDALAPREAAPRGLCGPRAWVARGAVDDEEEDTDVDLGVGLDNEQALAAAGARAVAESILQNRGMVALGRAPQGYWAPAGPAPVRVVRPSETPQIVVPGAMIPCPAHPAGMGPSEMAQWWSARDANTSFNQPVGARSGAGLKQ